MIGTYPADTLGYLREMRMGLFAHCDTCYHVSPVLDTLIDRFGPDEIYIQRKWPLKCGECGSRKIVVLVAANAPK